MYLKPRFLQLLWVAMFVATANFATAQTQLIKSLKINNGGGGTAPTALWLKTPFSGNVAADSLLTWSTTDSSVRKIVPFTDWYKFGSTVPAANADSQYVMGRVAIGQNKPDTVASSTSGSTLTQRLAKLAVAGGDASINGIAVGLGGGQVATNTAVGSQALYNNTTGTWNTAVGYHALTYSTSSNNNTAIGINALNLHQTGNNNTAVGTDALYTNAAGANNTAVGYYSLFKSTGNNNTALGNNAGQNQTAGDNNIVIGNNQDLANLTGSNQLNIGGAIFGTGLTGTAGAPAGNIGIGTATPGARLEVNNGTTNGAIKIVDGTQALGRVLTSDANGLGTWQLAALKMMIGTKSSSGVTFSLTNSAPSPNGGNGQSINMYTGTSIMLPPGEWKVDVQMLMRYNATFTGATGNSYVWIRTTFSDSPTTLAVSNDIDETYGTTYVSGLSRPGIPYALMQGYVLINNTSGANKTYYYYVYNFMSDVSYPSLTILNFGGNYWGENVMVATPVLQ